MDIEQAAALLGAKVAEIAAVDESDGGSVITTTAGTRYVVLAEGSPDAEGKTGLMLLAAPSDGPVVTVDGVTTWNGFPLHVPWPDLGEGAVVDADANDESTAAAVETKPVRAKSRKGR